MSIKADSKNRFDIRTITNNFSIDDAQNLFIKEVGFEQKISIKKLFGGFSNTNFLVQSTKPPQVIRFYSAGSKICSIEADIIKLANAHGVSVPKVLIENIQYEDKFANIIEYVEGFTLAELIDNGSDLPLSIFEEIGKQLALIHSISFEKSGLLGPGPQIAHDTSNSTGVLEKFVLAPLSGRAGQRLGRHKDQLIELILKNWTKLESKKACLVHCDFNPKNILIHKSMKQVTIIDWEFAMAGERLIDFGNFFRFDTDYSESMTANMLRGYESILGPLPHHWKADAKLHDLISLIHFLDSEEERPKTFATSVKIIESTLFQWFK